MPLRGYQPGLMPGVGQYYPTGPRVAMLDTPDKWKRLATLYSLIPNAWLSYPAAIVRACQRVDPGFMLMVVRNVYLGPTGGTYTFDRYVQALGDDGTRMDKPHPDFLKYPVIYPSFYTGLRPHEILDIMEGDSVVRGLPGLFQPFTWEDYRDFVFRVKRMEAILAEVSEDGGRTISQEKLNAMIQRVHTEARESRENRLRAEVDYRWDQDWGFIRRQSAKLGHSDLKEAGLV